MSANLEGVTCPQCGAAMPRRAKWFSTTCESCGTLVQREVDRVERSRFKAAADRVRLEGRSKSTEELRLFGGEAIALGPHLGEGRYMSVRIARRLIPHPQLLVLRTGKDAKANARLANAHNILRRLRESDHPQAAYFRTRLPAPFALRMLSLIDESEPLQALALALDRGTWGPLSAVHENYRTGLDPRHVVWIWRRVLEVLDYAHGQGIAHGALCLDHLIVQPRDHGVVLTGWSIAQAFSPKERDAAIARDLQQLAYSMRALLGGMPQDEDLPTTPAYVPKGIAALVELVCTSEYQAAQLAAMGLHSALGKAAREAYGAPRFLEFSPTR
jgi:hypothetical protein